jgi:glycolate oxidase FAD binding subunit
MTPMRPETADQVAEAVQTAIVESRRLEVAAGATKAGWGRPIEADTRLDLAGLAGGILYEPEELVLTAKPATPLAEIEALLAERRQHLAFEPPDLSQLFGSDGTERRSNIGGTLGGALFCNLAGPRRIKVGAARDHILGFHGVSGRGERFKAGGRVVKNVTGFDLSKLIAGSFGTLAAVTEVTVRALPAPERTCTVVLFGLSDADGGRAMTIALTSTCDVSGAAHLPPEVAATSSVPAITAATCSATLLRLEGPDRSVASRAKELSRLLYKLGTPIVLDAPESGVAWREIRDASFFAGHPHYQVWRLSVPPSAGADVVAQILDRVAGYAFYDWGGGLIWLALHPCADACEAVVRGAARLTQGHATLLRAAAEVRARVAVFQPQPPHLAALTRRIKLAFDPYQVLNPGRMYADV